MLEYLSQYFEITVFYYNPNISPKEEYEKRVEEQRRLIEALPSVHPIRLEAGPYEPERFYQASRGHEQDPEGGERCFSCYRLRLEEAARIAQRGEYDYFTTTLTISPLKNAEKLNEIGEELEGIYAIKHLPDFKKKNGYKRPVDFQQSMDYTVRITAAYFSKREREAKPENSRKKRIKMNNDGEFETLT